MLAVLDRASYRNKWQSIMMNNDTQKLTLDQPAAYQIKVPGVLDERWSDWDGDIISTVERNSDGLSITIDDSPSSCSQAYAKFAFLVLMHEEVPVTSEFQGNRAPNGMCTTHIAFQVRVGRLT